MGSVAEVRMQNQSAPKLALPGILGIGKENQRREMMPCVITLRGKAVFFYLLQLGADIGIVEAVI